MDAKQEMENGLNGDGSLSTWGKIHCCECERPIAYFAPGCVDEDDDLELYCYTCAEALDKENQ